MGTCHTLRPVTLLVRSARGAQSNRVFTSHMHLSGVYPPNHRRASTVLICDSELPQAPGGGASLRRPVPIQAPQPEVRCCPSRHYFAAESAPTAGHGRLVRPRRRLPNSRSPPWLAPSPRRPTDPAPFAVMPGDVSFVKHPEAVPSGRGHRTDAEPIWNGSFHG